MKLMIAVVILSLQTSQAARHPFPKPDKYYAIISDVNPKLSLGKVSGYGNVACQDTWYSWKNLWAFVKVGNKFRLINKNIKSRNDKLTTTSKNQLKTNPNRNSSEDLWKIITLGGRKVRIVNAKSGSMLEMTQGEFGWACGMGKKKGPDTKNNVWRLDDQTYNPATPPVSHPMNG